MGWRRVERRGVKSNAVLGRKAGRHGTTLTRNEEEIKEMREKAMTRDLM